MQTVRETGLVAGPKLLAAIGDPGGIHRVAEPAHAVQVCLAVHFTEEPALFEPDAVLARDGSAQTDAQADDLGGEVLGTIVRAGSRPSYRISGWRFPSPAWNTLATRMPWRADSRFDRREGLAQARARHHAVLHDEIRTEAADRGERATCGLSRCGRDRRRRRATRVSVAPDSSRIRISRSNSLGDLRALAFELDEEHGGRAGRDSAACTAASAASIASRSMISMAPGSRPDWITRDTASPAACSVA